MIKVNKENEKTWCVWNTKTGKTADIVKISEYNAFFPNKTRYRVDVSGITVDTLIENFQTAKGVAYKAVKKA